MLRSLAHVLARPRSLALLVASVLAAAMLVVAVTPIHDPDVWWVAAAGRDILARHAVPHENAFSFVEPDHPWVMHEWLFAPLYALALSHFGPASFAAIALVSMALALALLATGTVARANDPRVGLLMLLATVVFFGARFLSARPTGVALLFPISLTLLAFAPRFSFKSALLAVLLELVWSNAHGSFPLGVVLLLVAALDTPQDRPLRLAATVAAALATLLTPYGLTLHRFVWDYFRGTVGVYRAINLHIKEFGTFFDAWGSTVGPVDLVALLFLAALIANAARSPRYRVRALFALALVALALRHARHLELAGLLSSLLLLPSVDPPDPVAPGAPLAWHEPARPAPRSPPLPKGVGSRHARGAPGAYLVLLPAYVVALVAFTVAACRRPADAWVAAGPAFLRALSAVPDNARALVPFPTAALALWYAAPRGVRVFFDSRNDPYSASTFAAFWSLESTGTPADTRRTVLRDSATDTALVPSSHPMALFLATEPGWTLTRQDGDWRVYRRTP